MRKKKEMAVCVVQDCKRKDSFTLFATKKVAKEYIKNRYGGCIYDIPFVYATDKPDKPICLIYDRPVNTTTPLKTIADRKDEIINKIKFGRMPQKPLRNKEIDASLEYFLDTFAELERAGNHQKLNSFLEEYE